MKKIFIFLMFFFLTFQNVLAEGNYVTSITIDGVPVEGFESSKTDYELKVDSSKEKVQIVYTYDKTTYQVNGSYGEVNLNYGKNELSFHLKDTKDLEAEERTYHLTILREDTRSNDNSLSSLTVAGNKVVLGNGNDYNVSVDSKLTSVEVRATLSNNKASFVDGYGERIGNNAVTLSGENTSLEVRVKAENEEIRTYKITITKANYKSNDATLKSLTIDSIPFDFKPTTYEYTLTAPSNLSKIKINAVPNSDKASLEYKEEVALVTGENSIYIKVTAEDSTVRTYKLTINKEEELPLVSDIKIKDIDFTFDSKKYSYTIETELETLDMNITLSKATATYEITGNENLKNGSIITLQVKDDDKTTTYKFKIVNKKEAEEETVVSGKEPTFFEKYEMLIGLAIFGIGLLSLLVAILLKPKSQIM